MRRVGNSTHEEIDVDAQLRALHDDDCDLRIFLGGRAMDEYLNGPRDQRLGARLSEEQENSKKQCKGVPHEENIPT